MGKIIAISNQKGGVGKTTTAINLSACLAQKDFKVLAIDTDPQGNLTSGLGIDKSSLEASIYDIFAGETKAEDAIIKTPDIKKLDLIPSSVDLYAMDLELGNVKDKEFILRDELKDIKDKYDYIIIDCPPALSTLTVNALVAADSIVVPIQCEYYALEGLTQLIKTVKLVQDRLNQNLTIEGILFTMYDTRTKLAQDVIDEVEEHIGERIFYARIPRNVRLAEAPSFGQPICIYDPESTGARAYRRLATEIVKGE